MHRQVEWQTVGLAVAVYGSWGATLAVGPSLPAAAAIVLIGLSLGWHSSLQHELLHGHPFLSQRVNNALGFPPLLLRLPYLVYRDQHLAHHSSESLTEPDLDVESFYITAGRWNTLPRALRGLVVAHHTLLGRMVTGPAVVIVRFLASQLRVILAGDRRLLGVWAVHLVGVAGVVALAMGVAGVRWWVYLGGVYVGHSVSLVRSYLEHRWVDDASSRCATVTSGPLLSLLFLNNNLHEAHHSSPGVAWYDLPARSRESGSAAVSEFGAGTYSGYRSVVARHMLQPFDHPVHPRERHLATGI